jgi:predicted negative regulator of RcsB-dependent stress response
MTSVRKEQAKALRSPDQLQVKLMSILDWLLKNVRLLLYVVIPVVAIMAISYGYRYVLNQKRESRLGELGAADVAYEKEARKANEERTAIQKKADDLQKAMDKTAADAKAKDPKASVLPDPAKVAEKDALTKQAEAIKADHSGSRAMFEAFAKKYDTTPEGWAAAMAAVRIDVEQEKFAEARPLVEEVLAKSKDNPFYQRQARFALVGLDEELGDYDKALGELDALEKIVDDATKPKVLLDRGRIQLLKNAKAEAKATFATLIEKHGTTPEAQKARSMQALLD